MATIGVQIIGRRFDDHGVLAMAKTFEDLRGPQKPWPKAPEVIFPVIPGRALLRAAQNPR